MDIYQILITHNRPWSVREIVAFIAGYTLLTALLCFLSYKNKIKKSQVVGSLLAVAFLAIVFASTVFTRTPGERLYELRLFWSWDYIIKYQSREILQENLLNCVLLFPLGMCLPFVFTKKLRWWQGLLLGLLVSFTIESCQLIFCRGLFEWDDMVHNGIGCMLGCISMNLILKHGRKLFTKS